MALTRADGAATAAALGSARPLTAGLGRAAAKPPLAGRRGRRRAGGFYDQIGRQRSATAGERATR